MDAQPGVDIPVDTTTTEKPGVPTEPGVPAESTAPGELPAAPTAARGCDHDRRARWPTSAGRSDTTPPAEPWSGSAVFDLALFVSGISQAVELVSQPGTGRLFVVGRDGVVHEARDGTLLEPAFLDIEPEVLSQYDAVGDGATPPHGSGVYTISAEQGLLSLAFHPDYQVNNLLYTFHTRFGDGHSVVTEWRAPPGGVVDKGSSRTVVVFEQNPSLPNHKGGQLGFGPDGLLYIAVGDGGSQGDPYCHGQNRHTPDAALVRIDPEPSSTDEPYTVPMDNPYADGVSGHPAVWATGLRNPWRFTIDGALVIIADVGWNGREEVNVARIGVDAGVDFGWSSFEGEVCIRVGHCDDTATVPPAVYYSHDDGVSVIGGHVYRGSAIPELEGRYFYADLTGGWLRTVTFDRAGRVTDHTEWTSQLSDPSVLQGVYGFGMDAAGEIYIVTDWGSSVYKLVPAT